MTMQTLKQSFNDGICTICAVSNCAERGMQPKAEITVKHAYIRYARRIVGIGRFWGARQNNVIIDQLLRIPLLQNISTQDILILEDGTQYKIRQIQYKMDIKPPSTDLSLERNIDVYDIRRI